MSEVTAELDAPEDGADVAIAMEIPPPPAKPRATPKKYPNVVDVAAPRGPVRAQLDREDELSIADWFSSLGADGAVKIQITRKAPRLGPNGENILGMLETVEHLVDEDYLRETWGGGEFQLKVNTQDQRGNWKYFKGRTIRIAGEPKMNGRALGAIGRDEVVVAPAPPASGPLAERAFDMMVESARRAEERAELARSERPSGGLDAEAITQITRPFVDQLRIAQQTIADLQSQMLQITSRPPPTDAFRDQLLERALHGENQRVETLRVTYEQRIEKIREEHERQIKRLEERHADDLRRLEDRHERELRMSEKAQDASGKGQQVAFDARLEALKDSKAALERELNAAQSKIAALEARKDQTISEKADELIKVKEALDGIGGDGDGGDEKWYEKAIGALGQAPAVLQLIEKVGGGPPQQGQPQQQAQQQQMQLPPPGVPFQGPDGQVYVRNHAGQIAHVDQQMLRRLQDRRNRRRARGGEAIAAAAPEGGGVPAQPELAPPKPVRRPRAAEVRMAVSFMENALRSGAAPDAFAASARSLIPGDILAFIQSVGIDAFLNSVGLEPGSPLTTIRGRNFARAVAQILLTGAAEVEEAAPAEASEATPEVEPEPEIGDDLGDIDDVSIDDMLKE